MAGAEGLCHIFEWSRELTSVAAWRWCHMKINGHR